MNSYENKITFDLNETLLFELGQEIEEMISISLDPDIVIQEYDDYVQIRGVIMLSGEYFRKLEERELSSEIPLQNNPPFRYIEKVIQINRDVSSFSHRFPVEISVSKDRVDHMEDIVVAVDSFDYQLPTSDSLNIVASLHIYGITPEQIKDLEEKERRPIVSATDEDEFAERKLTVEKNNVYNDNSNPNNIDISTYDHETSSKTINETDSEEQPLRLIKGIKNEEETASIEKLQLEAIEQEIEDNKENMTLEEVQQTNTEDEIQIELNESTDEDNDEVNDVTFLTELFNSDEETYTQLKIYIAQKDDTVESIAKQYDIPVLQLIKDNKMSMDSIEEGQLITIRQRKSE